VIFVVEKATPKQHAALSKNQWTLIKRTLSTEVLSEKKYKVEKAQALAPDALTSKQEDSSSEEDEDDKDKKAFVAGCPLLWHL
jgi:predicted metal-binding transcription factor (methanogenesis marker protein 9)